MTDPRATVEPGLVLGGRYRVVEPIDRGGLGDIWLTDDVIIHWPAAVKLLPPPPPPPLGADFAPRLRERLRLLSSIRNNGLVSIYDYGVGPGEGLFILVQHVPGKSLAQILAAKRRLGPERAMAIVAGVAGPLADVHAAGVVHGELWPRNVLVRPDGMVILSLFGLARHYELPRAGPVMPAERARYLSPEQLTDAEAQAASDVYTLGVIAYHCLAGHPPFDGQEPPAFRGSPPPLPRRVPKRIRSIVERTMVPTPEDRPSLGELVAVAPAS
jgi:serine/threonine-protein kinase